MFKILLILSVRSLRSHKITTFIVGSIIFFGAWLLITGTAVLDSLERGLEHTVISSVTGHLQAYSSDARDDLAMFGSGFVAVDDIGEMPDFGRVKRAMLLDHNVQAVVPMGIQFHALASGNELDEVMNRLNVAVRDNNTTRIATLGRQIRSMAHQLEAELAARMVIAADDPRLRQSLEAVRTVQTSQFWHALQANPQAGLQLLDTQIAPLGGNGPTLYLRDVGTDLQAFAQNFDRFVLVDGRMVPPGHRGFLFAKTVYEKQLKNSVARSFDDLAAGLADPQRTLQNDGLLKELAERLPEQYQRISFQLDPEQSQTLETSLRQLLPHQPGDLSALLQAFLQVDDQNFAQRRAFFYSDIAPLIRLYAVAVGDTMTLQSVTKGGYTKSIRVKVYGTFSFTGLDKSALAGAQNLVDLVTFRDLYGTRDAAEEQELAAMRRTVALQDIEREQAEAQMFTDTTTVHAHRTAQRSNAEARPEPDRPRHAAIAAPADTYTQADIDNGVALNAAIMLREPRLLDATRKHLVELLHDAALKVQVVDWQAASGLVSRFIVVIHLFLYVATTVIFLVALVIMTNAMTMATAERAREIGTIRAMGGQRRFIMVMYVFETLTLGLIAGSLGAFTGFVTIVALGIKGIPAASDIMIFLFSGPRFYPVIHASDVIFGMVAVLFVSLVSTLYPARVATRVQPVVAMQAKE